MPKIVRSLYSGFARTFFITLISLNKDKRLFANSLNPVDEGFETVSEFLSAMFLIFSKL